MNQNLITDQVFEHIAGAMKYLLEGRNDVKNAGVLWGYLLALRDVEAITVEEWRRWQNVLITAELFLTEDERTTELIKQILSCNEPLEVMKIWGKKSMGKNYIKEGEVSPTLQPASGLPLPPLLGALPLKPQNMPFYDICEVNPVTTSDSVF